MLASVIGLLYFFMLLFAIAATVLFQDAAYFACVDSSSGDMLAETATAEMWGCGAEACPSNMTCQVRQQETCEWHGVARHQATQTGQTLALLASLCLAGVPDAAAAANRRLWQHWAQPAVHVPGGE